jgi:transposase
VVSSDARYLPEKSSWGVLRERQRLEVARELGLSRKTVRKMLACAVPPGYQLQEPVRRPKLDPWSVPSTPH